VEREKRPENAVPEASETPVNARGAQAGLRAPDVDHATPVSTRLAASRRALNTLACSINSVAAAVAALTAALAGLTATVGALLRLFS
jgi:hypothetical protein